jgi:hypothetical protein
MVDESDYFEHPMFYNVLGDGFCNTCVGGVALELKYPFLRFHTMAKNAKCCTLLYTQSSHWQKCVKRKIFIGKILNQKGYRGTRLVKNNHCEHSETKAFKD